MNKGKGKQNTLLQDVNAGTLLGAELHLFDFPNLFTSETCEKTKLLEIDRMGFDLFMKEFVRAKYAKYEAFYRGMSFLRRTKISEKAMLSLITMTNSKKVMADTMIVKQDDPCKFLYFVAVG